MTRTFLSSPKHLLTFLSAILLFLSSCFSESPQRFFDIAILNTNMITDFATPRLSKSILDETKEFPDIPSSKKKGDEAVQNITNKILYIEQSLEKIKKLSTNGEDTEEIKKISTELYELVIPVYKNEYMAYAKLCDSKAPLAEIQAMASAIDAKYAMPFELKYTLLMEKGKAYASKHNLPVNWGK